LRKVIYITFLVFNFLLIFNISKAHSVLGSETRWRNLGNDTFEITLIVYTKCTDGATAFNPGSLVISSDSCSNSYSFNTGSIISSDTTEITPVCSTQAKICPISGGTGQSTAQVPIGIQKNSWTYKIYLGSFTNSDILCMYN